MSDQLNLLTLDKNFLFVLASIENTVVYVKGDLIAALTFVGPKLYLFQFAMKKKQIRIDSLPPTLYLTILKISLAFGLAAVRSSSNKTISVEVICAPALLMAETPTSRF